MIDTFIKTTTGTTRSADVQHPNSRLFRQAWLLDGAVIEVDMPGARAIWRDKIRAARAPVLLQLDAAFLKALESGDTVSQQEIAVQKQVLRDAPDVPQIELASTVQELAAVQPAGLTVV